MLVFGSSGVPTIFSSKRASAASLAIDQQVTTHQTSSSSSIVSPVFTTTQPNELLVAFLSSDGPAAANSASFTGVSGGGLTWQLRSRANTQAGTAEIWAATSATALNNISVTATNSGSYQASINVVTFIGADIATSGATSTGNGSSGAPSVSLATTRAGSWVWGVGTDWDSATSRTVGVNQTAVDEFLAPTGDTYWVQRQSSVTPTAGTVVTINDTSPTIDRWNMSLIEIIPSGASVAPPTVQMTAPSNGATVSNSTTVSATASDSTGVAGVQFLLDGASLGAEVTTSPYSISWDTTKSINGSHTLSARARNTAGVSAAASSVNVTIANSGSSAAIIGQWGAVTVYPEVSIHAALTPTGKVLTIQGDFAQGGLQYLYNPANDSINQVPSAAADLFCAGQAVTADGRILVIGGTATSGGLGIKDVTAFNPTTETWQNLAPMNHARWYATGTTLGDGRVMAISGYNTAMNDLVTIPEIYNVKSNTWTDMAASAVQSIPIYPFMYQLPDGRLLQAGASEVATSTKVLDINTQQWSTIDGRVIDGASIVNYAPNLFMKAGSAADGGNTGASSNTAFTLDMSKPSPTWQPTGNMAFPRSFVNLTSLPDGTVLATGGDTTKTGASNANGVLQAELWDPATGNWSTMASMGVARLYHSTALLLPDGRVFESGSGGDVGVPDQKNYQIYSPPYLFKGARPTISSVPSTVSYGARTFVGTPDGANISKVMLIRTGSVTHSFDQNGRAVPLSFTNTTGGLNIQMPSNGNTAPPGYYMLFIVSSSGVPSVASMVRFPAAYENTTPPTAPTNLTGTGSIGTSSLSWTASTSAAGIAGYVVYRSATPGFAASATNKVGTSTTTSFTDSGVPAGTYYYQVQAQDSSGSLGASSNEVKVTVTADTIPPTAPTNLVANATSSTSVALNWVAATDNVGVTGYNVLRNGVSIGTTTTATTYNDATVVANTTYTYTVTARDAAGNVGPASNPATVTTPVPTALAVDTQAVTHQTSAATTISSPAVSTSGSNELLLAFIASDGPIGSQTISGVSGGGLTWRLRQRTNGQAGTAEIWQAVAPAKLSNIVVTATVGSGSYVGSMVVTSFVGANLSTDGAVSGASATTGAPSATLTTTHAGSQVWAVGNDWDNAIARTVGSGQTKVDEYLVTGAGDTFWVQRQTSPVVASGTTVTINDTVPATDRYNLSLIEILSAN
jgi:fibronectin type 3 domain-containing protein